ncbi:MAG: HAMP domain-containing sensor histidine kinase, partial [Campylobacterota bacterium]|nr:HAMP domain-containing sensor histidine kinase [Campylobacterota bacterium]
WKQPLNILSLNSQSLKIRYQSNQLNENTIDLIIKKFLTQIEFMSDTIDDFKNFFSISKEKMEFKVHEEIQSIIKILESKIHSHDIKISINKKFDCSITSYKNEFKQALFNIINNMIDIFDERVIENPYIKIDIEYDYMDCVITLHDNGGGIATQLLPERLFEPYVTTKGETGTGIGLQITKDIIINSFNGEIKASNVDNGAQFIIKLPLIT